MRDARKEARGWKIAAVISFVSAVLGFALAVLCAIKLWYIPLIICVVVTAHGFLGGAVYYSKSAKLSDLAGLLSKMHECEIYDTAPLADFVGYKTDYAASLLKQAEYKGYMTEYISEGYIMKNSMAENKDKK